MALTKTGSANAAGFKGANNAAAYESKPELARRARRTPPGMMYWSGTSADPTATCGSCKHLGFDTVIRDDSGNALDARRYPTGCVLYKKYMERAGAPLDPKTPACKYYEAKKP